MFSAEGAAEGQGRPLRRVGLREEQAPAAVLGKLRARGVTTVGGLLGLTALEVVELTGLRPDRAAAVRREVAAAVQAPPRTALQLLRQARGPLPSRLRTGVERLDAALGGGLPAGMVVELVGPPGSGKSQFCLGAAARTAVPGRTDAGLSGQVLYIDTEAKFDAARALELAGPGPHGRNPRALLERILVMQPGTCEGLLGCLRAAEKVVIDYGVKLLVVDSVAAPVKRDFGPGVAAARERAETLGQCAVQLKWLADVFGIPVLVTNHTVTTYREREEERGARVQALVAGDGEDGQVAAMGLKWTHCVNVRLVMQQEFGRRLLRISKSPLCPQAAFEYVLAADGVREGAPTPEAARLNADLGTVDLSLNLLPATQLA